MKKLKDCCIHFTEYKPIFSEEVIQPYILTLYKDVTLEIFDYYINEVELEHILMHCADSLQIEQYLASLNIECFDYSQCSTQEEYNLEKPKLKYII